MTYNEAKIPNPYILFRKSKMIRHYAPVPEEEQVGKDWAVLTKSQEKAYWQSFMLPEIRDRLKRGVYAPDVAKDIKYLLKEFTCTH